MSWNKQNIIGKKICVGIVYLDGEGKITDRVQNHGEVVYADDEVIQYKLKSLSSTDELFTVPAYYDNLENADPQVAYILEDSNEIANNIDIIATYTVIPEK